MQAKINILLVDDQPSKLLSYRALLDELGENLIAASSAREAFEKLLRTEIAVILMDVQMPDLDGFELAAMIREHPRFEKTAIIFVSAIHLSDLDQIRGYAAGAVDYVSVPIVPEVLRAKVRVFADLYRKTRQLEQMNEELERRVSDRTAELMASTERLKGSEQRRSIALAAASMGSWDWEPLTGKLVWDEGQFRICGRDPQIFEPTAAAIASLIHPDDVELVRDATTQCFESGQTFHAEFRIRRPNGEVRWCIASAVPSFDERGRVGLLSGVTYDITERKLAEQALAQMNEDLERRIEERTREREVALAQLFEAQKTDTIGQLTGGVAHDFNNLLMAVLGCLDLVRKRVSDAKSVRLLNNAIEAAERGATLTKRLLAFARRQELRPVAVDVAALIKGMEGLLRRALGPSVRLMTSFREDLPAVEIDSNQLELALLNLAVNARDAMPDGGSLSISADVEHAPGGERLSDGDYVCLTLVDTGAGMDEAILAKATEPFFTTKGPGRGTGLGLSMVHGMAAQSGGALHLSSIKGQGTTVQLFLPLANKQPAAPRKLSEQVVSPAETQRRRLKVLVVDDDALVRIGAAAMIEDLGHTVLEAESGAEALRLLSKMRTIDLVLTDYAMPGMNGAELIRQILALDPQMPTIFASGYAEASSADLGALTARLSKPFNQAELAAAIKRVAGAPPENPPTKPDDVRHLRRAAEHLPFAGRILRNKKGVAPV